MTEAANELEARIESLKQEHSALQNKLDHLQKNPLVDDLEIQEIKKQKLSIKDSIFRIEAQMQH